MNQFLPTLLMGVMAIICAFAVFLLPETRGQPLPDTIAEIEKEAEAKNTNIV